MSDQDDQAIQAIMAANFPGVPVTEAGLAATRPAALPPPLLRRQCRPPTPNLQSGPRSDSGDTDARRFERYMEQNFPGAMPSPRC